MNKLKYLFLFLPLFIFSCKKQQLFNQEEAKTVKLTIKGYVMTDTLEFVLNNKVLGNAINTTFHLNSDLFRANDQIIIRKKSNASILGNLDITSAPFSQVKKIFYDGTKLSENVEVTPVKDRNNMGFRAIFSTQFVDFYGGPVDIEFFESYINWDTFEFVNSPLNITIKNVSGSFGDFIELPPLAEEHTYSFKVYKSGTKDLPYTSNANLLITDPENNYGTLDFSAGESKLLAITPTVANKTKVGDGYSVTDYSAPFK